MERVTLAYIETNVPIYQDVDGTNWEQAYAMGDTCTGCGKRMADVGEACYENGNIALLCSDCVEIVAIEDLWRAYDYAGDFLKQGAGQAVKCISCQMNFELVTVAEEAELMLVGGHWVNKHPLANAEFRCVGCGGMFAHADLVNAGIIKDKAVDVI
jgi:hypothetical protein